MKKSFMTGAVILMLANVISKILGAVLKIPLTYIIHEEGMAVYNTAFSVYVMALSVAVSGIPFAVTRLVAGESAKGNLPRAKGAVSVAALILASIGAGVSVLLFFGARFFAYAMKEPAAETAIRAIAPSVFFVAIGAGYKGAFQGKSDMIPTAVSQCIEAVIKLLAGYFLARCFVRFGCEIAAAGAITGVTVGEITATVILAGWFIIANRKASVTKSGLVREIADIAVPIWGLSVITSAIGVCDTSLLRWGLLNSGLSEAEARYLYGAYSGYAMTVLNLPAGFLATLGVSVVPIISAAAAVGNNLRVRSVARKGILITSVCGGLAGLFFILFGRQVLELLFNNTASADILRIAAPSIAFMCVMQFTASVLQAMGRTGSVFVTAVICGIIKLLSAVLLVTRPEINIYGAAIGSDIAYFVGMVINLIFLART